MKIGELAAPAGLKTSAIRYYEKVRILEASHRVGGQRRYSADAPDRVLLICFAADMDFTLAEIKLPQRPAKQRPGRSPLEKISSHQDQASGRHHQALAPSEASPPALAALPMPVAASMRAAPKPQPNNEKARREIVETGQRSRNPSAPGRLTENNKGSQARALPGNSDRTTRRRFSRSSTPLPLPCCTRRRRSGAW